MLNLLFNSHQFFYLDPGSGSFIIQMLIAGVLGAGLGITIFWNKIKSLFGKGKPQQDESEDETEDEDESK
jgi:hypothetical protein